MKKVAVSISVILLFIFLVGCFDYKAYQVSDDNKDELSLVEEIAQIEKELGMQDNSELEELDKELEDLKKEEEVVLPELGSEDGEVQVLTVNEKELVKLNVKANDPDQDEVKYSFSPPLNKDGEWQTTHGDAGEYLVTLTATDGVLTTTKKVRIVVNKMNVAPVIGEVKDLFVKEGKTISFEPEVTDPNGDSFTVTISEPLKKGIFAADHSSAGEYKITVIADDGELKSEKTFKLTVEDVNMIPELKGLSDLTVKEGETVKLTPEVLDLDEDEVTVKISEPVGDDGVWETTFTDHGTYQVTVTATDGKDTVTKQVSVVVEDVNKAPEFVEVTLGS